MSEEQPIDDGGPAFPVPILLMPGVTEEDVERLAAAKKDYQCLTVRAWFATAHTHRIQIKSCPEVFVYAICC